MIIADEINSTLDKIKLTKYFSNPTAAAHNNSATDLKKDS